VNIVIGKTVHTNKKVDFIHVRHRHHFSVLLILSGALTAITIVLPAVLWPFSLIAQFLPQLCIVSLVAIIIGLVREKWLVAGVFAVVSVLTFWKLGTGINQQKSLMVKIPASASSLRIVHANLFHRDESLDRFLTYIEPLEPDVIALTELPAAFSKQRNESLSDYNAYSQAAIGGNRKTILLAKAGTKPTQVTNDETAELVVPMPGGRQIRLVSIHPAAPLTPWHRKRRDESLMSVFRTQNRSYQNSGIETIIIGDFNAAPWSHILRSLGQRAGFDRLVDPSAIKRFSGTWISKWPAVGVPIDHAYGTNGVRVITYDVGHFIGSDHFPIVLDITIADNTLLPAK